MMMIKRDRIRLVRRVFAYLERQKSDAYEVKNEADFDWYSEGQEAF